MVDRCFVSSFDIKKGVFLACTSWHVPSYIVNYGLSGSTILIYIISQTARFSEKFIANKMCVFISLQLLSETLSILRIIQRGIIIDVHRSSWKVLVVLVRF